MDEKATEKAISNEAENGLKNTVGTIAMARTAYPNSATSQFFINVADNDFLNYKDRTPKAQVMPCLVKLPAAWMWCRKSPKCKPPTALIIKMCP